MAQRQFFLMFFFLTAQCTFTATSNGNGLRGNLSLTKHFGCTGCWAKAVSVKFVPANLEFRVRFLGFQGFHFSEL